MLPPSGGATADPRKPYTRCEGLYPWFIYKNLGQGDFASTPTIKYQPIPLESDAGDANLTGRRIASQRHAVMDFDGDGILDAVVRPQVAQGETPPRWLFVWTGDGTGGFSSTKHLFYTRREIADPDANAISMTAPVGSLGVVEKAGMVDLNGDGLPDQWIRRSAGNANTAFHLGADTFDLLSTNVLVADPDFTGTENTPTTPSAIAPVNEMTKVITNPNPWLPNNPILAGSTTARNRTVDVDNDGRVDIVKWETSSPPQVYFNFGGEFVTPGASYLTNTGGLERTTEATSGVPLKWQLKGDLIDLDGDGVAESVYFDTNGYKRYVRNSPAGEAPPRLLQPISNGRGAHSLVTYASMHDTSTVTQDPTKEWFDGRSMATPRTQWVVKSVATTDDFAATTSSTSYKYSNPRHGADDEGRFAFRGFEHVDTVAPSGMTSVQWYDYEVDWSGRLLRSYVASAEAPGEVQSISKTKWTGRTLFGGLVKSFFPTIVENFTCSNGQNESACLGAPAGYTRTESTLADFPLVGSKQLILETGSVLRKQVAAADGDRQTIKTFTMLVDADRYVVRPQTATKEHQVSGSMVMFGKSAQEWDPDLKAATVSDVWLDASGTNRAKTFVVYDLTTGNVLERWKPEQYAAGTTKTTLEYDSRKLFVSKETNELGHVRDFLWEYGTGTKLQTDGPNVRTCTSGCGAGLVKEQSKIRIDGIGRPIEIRETFSDDGANFTSRIKETTSYVDAVVVPTTPSSSTHQVRLTTAASPATMVRTDVDGHGRPIKRVEFVQGTAPADHVTTWTYRNDGTLQSVSVPDPRVNTVAVVAYDYTFDSLGRATSIRRPDSTTAINRSGVDITYDGMSKTVTEYLGSAGGTQARTKTITDSFGRLTQVHERTSTGPEAFAVTNYTYGPDDNVVLVVDPQGVTTQLVHDLGGRRTQINRHGRSWKYSYDLNGNLKSEQVPGASLGQEALYTTTIIYDALNRPISKNIGQRGLSAPDQALFASGMETFTYDVGGNMTGRLRSWKSFAPGAPTPSITRDRLTDAQGLDTRNEHVYANVAGLSNNEFVTMKHNVAGMLTETGFSEGSGTVNTTAAIPYSARGFPTQMNVTTPAGASTIAVQTRDVSGLVGSRTTALGTDQLIENWSYDRLGRVTSHSVIQPKVKPTPSIRYVSQSLTYFGNDDVEPLGHTMGSGASKTFSYGYDPRHQITSAIETSTPGYFSSSYQYGVGGRFTNVNISQTAPGSGSELKPRNVNYQYADADPERVTALINAITSLPYASYQYDEAGNMTSRCYGATTSPCGGESADFVYDGKNQLRRVVKKQGTSVIGSEEYWYDDTGSRVTVLERDANGSKVERTQFLGQMEVHFNQSDVRQFAYLHLSLGTPVARIRRPRVGNTAAFEYMFHGLGDHSIASVSSSGVLNAAFGYAPFGEVIEMIDAGGISGADTHRRRFNDKYVDSTSNVIYYKFRYLDPILIQWIQSDPKYRSAPQAARNEPRRANLYSFSLNNSMSMIDPDGLDPKIRVMVQDLTRSSPSSSDAREQRIAAVSALVSATIHESFAGRAYFAAAHLILQHGGAAAQITPTTTASGAPAMGPGVQIVLADVKATSAGSVNPASVGAARDSGMGQLIAEMRSMTGDHALAFAQVGGNKILFSIDQILEKIQNERLDLNDPKDREKIEKGIERMLAHELAHIFGLDDNESVKGLLMNQNAPSFSDTIFIRKMQGEMDTLRNNVKARAK